MDALRKSEHQKKKKLDVLMISAVYDPPQIGGVASHVAWLAGALSKLTKGTSSRKLSCHVHVLTGWPLPLCGKCHLTVTRFSANKDKPFISPSSYPLAAQVNLVLNEYNRINPDIVHAHDFESAYIGMMLKSTFGIPLVVTIHKTPKEVDLTSARNDGKECFMRFMRQSGLVDKYVAPSNEYRRRLLEHEIAEDDVRLIYHGVPVSYLADSQKDPSVFERFKLNPKDLYVLCPARLDRHKGLETIIEAASLLHCQKLWKGYKYVIAGGAGEDEYREKLAKSIADYGIGDFIHLGPDDRGDCSPAEMKALYLGAEACVLPSRREGFGQALLEAFVYKTPVLAANTGGIPEVITPGVTGYLFDRDEPSKLAKQLCRLLAEKEKTREMVINARKLVENKFSAGRMAEEHLSLYLELANVSLF